MTAKKELILMGFLIIGAFLYLQAILFIMEKFDLWNMGMMGIMVATMILFTAVWFVSLFIRLWWGE